MARCHCCTLFPPQVSAGYRPPCPPGLNARLWSLISRCWHEDPVERPSMTQVVGELQQLQELGLLRPVPPRPDTAGPSPRVSPKNRRGRKRLGMDGAEGGGGVAEGPACGCQCTIS